MNFLERYAHWLHLQWPSGLVEKLPDVRQDGASSVPGLYIVGDLTGVPLLKLSSNSGASVVRTFLEDPAFQKRRPEPGVLDVVIVGAGIAGFAAALACRKAELTFRIFDAAGAFSTVQNFPMGKPIYTYPTDMVPEGDLHFSANATTREHLLEELHATLDRSGIQVEPQRVDCVHRLGDHLQVRLADREESAMAHRVVLAIGRSGNFRQLHVPGEDGDQVSNRLHDPADYAGKSVLVVGGGDSALETAIALSDAGAETTLVHRDNQFQRAKPENAAGVERRSDQKRIRLRLASQVREIMPDQVRIEGPAGQENLRSDAVFTMLGREAPLDMLRRCGVRIRGERRPASVLGLLGFLAFCVWLYHWKGLGFTQSWINPARWLSGLQGVWNDPAHLLGTVKQSFSQPWVLYSAAYALCVVGFGIRRIRRRRTPYVTRQTLVLTAIQVFPLFLLPCIVLPWAWHNGWFSGTAGQWVMAEFFPGGPDDFWRAFGLVLAWPLMAWNVFTDQPIAGWLVISFVQTFVIIPLIVWRWGKGAYCGWICSCGALAETMGDTHRQKMPHGPGWNRLNLLGQGILLFAFLLLGLRVAGWLFPASPISAWFTALSTRLPLINYKYLVDLWLAGILGVGLYFHFSGRMWCRFACPLAALMHIYARFSQFRILADKKKCISCNVCTTVCHQGIDVMRFANRGLPMADPQCVRCSACVQSCPTGVLQFGRIHRRTGDVLGVDRLPAAPKK